MYQDKNLAALFDWVSNETRALDLDYQLAHHNRAAEIEHDVANAPTEEELRKASLTPEQAALVEKIVDYRVRVAKNEKDIAMRKERMTLLQKFRDAVNNVANGEPPEGTVSGGH